MLASRPRTLFSREERPWLYVLSTVVSIVVSPDCAADCTSLASRADAPLALRREYLGGGGGASLAAWARAAVGRAGAEARAAECNGGAQRARRAALVRAQHVGAGDGLRVRRP